MIKFNPDSFKKAFYELGINEGDNLLIHNSLLKFGIPKEVALSRFPEIVYNYIQSSIGSSGTIIVPTFNFDFCKGIPFNRQETPSKGMGVFSEYVRSLPQSKRSFHPMQSVAVIGDKQEYIIEGDTTSSFSPGGPFDRLRKLNTKIVLLGADINAISVIHWVEEKYNVPYRYWKTFSGSYIDDGVTTERNYEMYVRSLDTNPALKLNSIETQLRERGLINEYKIGGGMVQVLGLNDFLSTAENLIKLNPYFFVSNHPMFELYERGN